MAITLFMRLTHTYTFALLFILTSTLSTAASLNPLNWFGFGDDPETQFVRIATADDEAAAAQLLEVGRDKMAAGSFGSASRVFKKINKNYPLTIANAEALYLSARIQMIKGRWEKAFTKLQQIVWQHPNFENYDQVISAQFECATAHMEGARGRILWVFPGFKMYDRAVAEFELIVSNAPYNDYAPLALMNIALISQQEEDPEIAIDALDRLINYYPQSMLAPDAYYKLAETYSSLVAGSAYDQGSTRRAISYYEDFLVLFPQSNFTGEVESNLKLMENLLASSRLNLGDFYYYYRSNNTAALIFYNEVITIAPDSEAAQEATDRIEDIESGVRPMNGATFVRRLFLVD
ncbi:MAG: outer membrane protein assembly factor BamD [Opitutaceae bacterium]